MNLKGKVIVITGGAQGLGKSIATTLAAAGATAVIADIKDDTAAATAEELRSKNFLAESLKLNVCDAAAAAAAIDWVVKKFGRLDVLVNNAGVDFTKPLEQLTVEEWDRVIRVNLRAPFLLSKLVFPVMSRQGGGHVVNVTSTAAKRAWPNAAAYHASKWGLLGFSHALFTEGRTKNIKVTALVAGGMRTPFILERFPDVDPGVLQDPNNVAMAVKFLLQLPEETVIPELMVIPMKETSWP